jgi:DNA topoisomerase IB
LRLNESPEIAAAEARLRYVNDGTPGIARHPTKEEKKFVYRYPDGKPVRDAATLDRIRKLAIPPAYRDVWICLDADGHLQATGKDARGRRQYRYHPRWREVRDEAKFGHMMVFARVLPEIRRRVDADLSRPGLPREKVLALQELAAATDPLPPKKSVLRAVEAVSKLLGNTPAICRKCYIHPAIFDGYLDGSLLDTLKKRATEELAQGVDKLKPEEAAVTGFLAHRLVQAVEHPEAEPTAALRTASKRAKISGGKRSRGGKSRPPPTPRIEVSANA